MAERRRQVSGGRLTMDDILNDPKRMKEIEESIEELPPELRAARLGLKPSPKREQVE